MIFFLDYKKYFKVRCKGHEIISDVHDKSCKIYIK